MTKICIDKLRVHASVGILEHELRSRQQLLISIEIDMPAAPTVPAGDDVHHVLDYRQLREIAKAEAETGHVNMLETLAGRIATRLLALHGVASARVRVVKPNIFPDCDGVAVEVTTASACGAA
ncbi:MAG: dihydroneopterin aldolase [Chitinophagaceae bacterium]|nr:dihydroneopterin aldolase [Rubrivivax sp.]